jgi:hypothetical protein
MQDEKHNLPYSREVLFSPSSTDLPGFGGIEVGAHPVFQAARLSGWVGLFGAISRSPIKQALAGSLAHQPNPFGLIILICQLSLRS